MIQAKKILVSFAMMIATAGVILLGEVNAARADGGGGVVCVVDVVVESRTQTGLLVSKEVYQKEFILDEGEAIFDDFSTRTRFKFLTASLQKENGDKTIAVNWFADVTVFNSVDFNTSVVLGDGQKRGKVVGDNTVYTSNGSTKTTFSLVCVEE